MARRSQSSRWERASVYFGFSDAAAETERTESSRRYRAAGFCSAVFAVYWFGAVAWSDHGPVAGIGVGLIIGLVIGSHYLPSAQPRMRRFAREHPYRDASFSIPIAVVFASMFLGGWSMWGRVGFVVVYAALIFSLAIWRTRRDRLPRARTRA
jgi:Flp pilus assembly protein TadB